MLEEDDQELESQPEVRLGQKIQHFMNLRFTSQT